MEDLQEVQVSNVLNVEVNDEHQQVISGRELHATLEIGTEFRKWFPRMVEYGFEEDVDFTRVSQKCPTLGGEQEKVDYVIKLDMAKEIAMIQRSEKGKEIRQYLIQVEKDWNSPEKTMARALVLADKEIKSLNVAIEVMKPKVDYFDTLVNRNLLTNLRDTAKELHVKQNHFINLLIDKKYLFRGKKGKLEAYAHTIGVEFELKECYNTSNKWCGTQVLVTPKGRETFRILLPIWEEEENG